MSIIKALRLIEDVHEIIFEAGDPRAVRDLTDELISMNKDYSISEVRYACEYLENQYIFSYQGNDRYGLY